MKYRSVVVLCVSDFSITLYNMHILKPIRAGVGFRSGTETSFQTSILSRIMTTVVL